MTDLRHELIEKCRRYVRINKDNHPWADMDDLQLLKSVQLYQEDPETKQSGVRILAFIQKHLPDPIYLEVIERRGLWDAIFREVASNTSLFTANIPAAFRLTLSLHKVK